MTVCVIETNNLVKRYKKQIAVNNLNLELESGKIYGLLGKNGAGKTTLMCMLLGLCKKSSGNIFLFDENLSKNKSEILKKVGSIIETPGFYTNLTGRENLELFSKLQNVKNKKNIDDVLKLVSLKEDENKLFKDYSLGMRQRLGIALSLIKSPELLILDEPINGLDPFGIIEIRNLLKNLSKNHGISILISSHILAEIEQIADVIIVMDEGKLVEETTIEELHDKIGRYVEFKVSDLKLACDILENLGFEENVDFSIDDESIRLTNHMELKSKINKCFNQSDIDVYEMKNVEENLEEYFINLIGD